MNFFTSQLIDPWKSFQVKCLTCELLHRSTIRLAETVHESNSWLVKKFASQIFDSRKNAQVKYLTRVKVRESKIWLANFHVCVGLLCMCPDLVGSNPILTQVSSHVGPTPITWRPKHTLELTPLHPRYPLATKWEPPCMASLFVLLCDCDATPSAIVIYTTLLPAGAGTAGWH